MQIVGSRLDIDEIWSWVTEPQKLEINCRRHVTVIIVKQPGPAQP